jgi:hypothetical protein
VKSALRRVRSWLGAILAMAAIGAADCAFAGYDANLSGLADGVYTYPSGVLLIHLVTQPSTHPACNASFFAVDPGTMDANAMSRMYARLLTSYAMQEPINIGYDSQGDCVDGYIHVWRIG